MKKEVLKLYESYSSYTLTFNQHIIDGLKVKVEDIALKIANIKVSAILYSSSMIECRLFVKLTKEQLNYIIRNKYSTSIRYSFRPEKHDVSFYVAAILIDHTVYNEDENIYLLTFNFANIAPDDLVTILGEYVDKLENMHKRAEERFIVNKSMTTSLCNGSIETFLFISGNGKRSILTEISIFSAKVVLVDKSSNLKKGTRVLLLLKCKILDGLGEMMGTITRIETINKEKELYAVVVTFDQETIPPTYKMWIADLIERVTIKR